MRPVFPSVPLASSARDVAPRAMQEDAVTVEHISIEPNNCPLEEPITLSMDFELRDHAGALQDAFWEVKFIADQTNKRKIVGTLSPTAHHGTHPRPEKTELFMPLYLFAPFSLDAVLGQTPPQEMVPGPQQMSFHVRVA